MRFYLHVLTDTERIKDPDGQECTELNVAQLEASQSARELMAEELRAGRPLPFRWRIQIADAEENVSATIASLAFPPVGAPVPDVLPTKTTQELIASARELIASATQRRAVIPTSIRGARTQLWTLGRLNAGLSKTPH